LLASSAICGTASSARPWRFQLDPQLYSLECGLLVGHELGQVCGVLADAGIAQFRRLLEVLLQRHVVGLAAQGELRQQQWVDAVVGESALRWLCGSGDGVRFRRSLCSVGGHRRLAGTGQQQSAGDAGE
jgi:hypothetical protein